MNDLLQSFLSRHAYTTVFVVLVLCGVGLPLPEEVPLVGGGWAVYTIKHGWSGWAQMVATATLAILVGDSITYGLGAKFGPDILRMRVVRRVLSPRRVRKTKAAFDKHGWKAVFFARFFPGLRLTAYFIAGTLRMRLLHFLLLDLLGCLITVPVSIWLGWYYGTHIDRAFELLHRGQHTVLVVLGLVVVVWLVWLLIRSRREEKVPVHALIDEVRSTTLESQRGRAGRQEAEPADPPVETP